MFPQPPTIPTYTGHQKQHTKDVQHKVQRAHKAVHFRHLVVGPAWTQHLQQNVEGPDQSWKFWNFRPKREMAREDKGRKDDEEHEEVRAQRAQRDVHGLPHFGERRVVLHQTKRRQKGQDQTQGVHVGDVVVPVECTKRWEGREETMG